jgi:hypothetical protein
MLSPRLPCFAVAATLLAAGCGDSDDGGGGGATQATPPTPPATTTSTPTPTTPERERRAADPDTAAKKKRLERAGFEDVEASGVEGVEPQPEAGLEFPLDGGGQVSIFVYASAADARAKADEFEKLARRYPAYFRVAVRGSTTYVGAAEQPEKLDRAAFDKAVEAAEN